MTVPADPLYSAQWHFDFMGNGRGRAAIERIWDEFNGTGIHVGVYDDGIQKTHYDLDDNYDPSRHVVINGAAVDGDVVLDLADPGNGHGTSCAGIIGAENNGLDTVGIAWGCDLTGVNIFDDNGPIFLNAEDSTNFLSAVRQMTRFDVTNNSWGSTPAFGSSQNLNNPNGFDAKTAAEYAFVAANGRGGLGTIIVQCAQNQNLNAQGDGLYVARHKMTVGALLENGFATSYSNYGACLLVSAAGGDIKGDFNVPVDFSRLITTTDLLDDFGFNFFHDPDLGSDYTDSFNGTSSATPMVAGIVALMLDANPNLGWRDVKDILALTACHTGSRFTLTKGQNENGTWVVNKADTWNGGGMHFSIDYGYGNADVFGAVRLAEAYKYVSPLARVSSNEQFVTTGTIVTNAALFDFGTSEFSLNLTGNVQIENVQLTVNLTHQAFTNLSMELVSAEGTVISLLDGSTGPANAAAGGLTWTFGIEALRGELSSGTWKLRISDAGTFGLDTLNSVKLDVFGKVNNTNDVYTFTNEFGEMAFINPLRKSIIENDGGVDWINCATLFNNAVVDLRSAQNSIIDGIVTILSFGDVFENAITGDGNDKIFGNTLANKLYGMRGGDTIEGGNGNDFINGGAGRDALDGGAGVDTADYSEKTLRIGVVLKGATGVSVTVGGVSEDIVKNIENVVGGGGHDIVTGGDGLANVFTGNGGNDTLTGNAGADTLLGGFGNDILSGGTQNDTLDGGLGFDTAVYSEKVLAVSVTLNGATAVAVKINGVNEDTIKSIENVTGGAAGDTLVGDGLANVLKGGGGADTLTGNGGADTLQGGAGGDQLNGGAANDVFLYTLLTDSLTSARDTISGFAVGDKIDVSAIDANTGASGNQAFVLADADAFFEVREIRQTVVSGNLVVDFNVDTDADVEMQLLLQGRTSFLAAGDFVL